MTAKYTLGHKHKVLSNQTVIIPVLNVVIVRIIHTALCAGGQTGRQ